MTDTETAPAPQPRKRRRWTGVLLGTALLGIGAVSGFAAAKMHGSPWWIMSAAHAHFDPARMTERVDRRVNRVLSRVDATNEQRAQVSAIVKSGLNDLQALNVKPWEARGKVLELLRADTVDPAALETLRAEHIAAADAASKRIVQAVSEAAAVLTPQQRRELTERWSRRHWRHG